MIAACEALTALRRSSFFDPKGVTSRRLLRTALGASLVDGEPIQGSNLECGDLSPLFFRRCALVFQFGTHNEKRRQVVALHTSPTSFLATKSTGIAKHDLPLCVFFVHFCGLPSLD